MTPPPVANPGPDPALATDGDRSRCQLRESAHVPDVMREVRLEHGADDRHGLVEAEGALEQIANAGRQPLHGGRAQLWWPK